MDLRLVHGGTPAAAAYNNMNDAPNIAMSGWSDGQCAVFARRLAHSAEGHAWWTFVEDIREALIDSFILDLVLSQRDEVRVEDIRSLRKRLVRK